MSTFRQAYSRASPVLKLAIDRLESLLHEVVGRIEDRRLVRARFCAVRSKSVLSLERKAREAGWTPDEALLHCADLIGGRVVCNNVEDVYRFESLLREQLPFEAGPLKRQDYILSPKDGYRALHVNFGLDVGEPLAPQLVPCEVQIRSRLQDAWAELSHSDIYKHDLPFDLLRRSVELSHLLATAEDIAGSIRARVRKVAPSPDEQPSLDHVSATALAFVFRDVFGRSPADYAVAMALSECKGLNIVSLEELPAILKHHSFRESLNDAYSQLLPAPIESESLLIAGLHAVAAGNGAALRYVREQATFTLEQIGDFARRELTSELPETVEQLIDQFNDPRCETDQMLLAAALDVADNCPYCHALIVDPFSVFEAAMHCYRLSPGEATQFLERIQDAVLGSGVEIGGFGDLHACSNCSTVLGHS